MLHVGCAAALVFCRVLSSACHGVAVDSAVELDHGGFGVRRGVSILYRPMTTVEQRKKTPVELGVKK